MTERPLPTALTSATSSSFVSSVAGAADDASISVGDCAAAAAGGVDESKESGAGEAADSAQPSIEVPFGSATVVLSYKKRCPEYNPLPLAVTSYFPSSLP